MQGGGGESGLRGQALEDYVLDKVKHFAVVFAQELVPGITQQQLDLAFSRALYSISAQETSGHAQLQLKFNHSCRFLGCVSQDCMLCKNNPHKTCGSGDNFDEAYADNQVLRARCEADVYVDLINHVSGDICSAAGVEVQVRPAVTFAVRNGSCCTAQCAGAQKHTGGACKFKASLPRSGW
eukprot:GHRQ01009022.1.p1 GENE.GHRQ01009022.1~~GHRQ01009022.1.p1  ORF type:complete len:181 (+),score=65.56 GHRQ01009022.1:311-853(+)